MVGRGRRAEPFAFFLISIGRKLRELLTFKVDQLERTGTYVSATATRRLNNGKLHSIGVMLGRKNES